MKRVPGKSGSGVGVGEGDSIRTEREVDSSLSSMTMREAGWVTAGVYMKAVFWLGIRV